jgi:DNA-binding MarR family transcriptional regulator
MVTPAPPDRSPAGTPSHARSLGFLLREAYGLLQQRIYDAVAASGYPGLRPLHSPVLRELAAEGSRAADLARTIGLAKQSVAYVVNDLVTLGYLRTEPDPDDGRARRILYTPRGQQLLEALLEESRRVEAVLAARLGNRRLQTLREALEDVLADSPPEAPANVRTRATGARRD